MSKIFNILYIINIYHHVYYNRYTYKLQGKKNFNIYKIKFY